MAQNKRTPNKPGSSSSPKPLGERKLPRPIRVGILGLGRIGWNFHAKTVREHNGFTLTAVCDVEPSRVAEAEVEAGVEGFTDYGKFLKSADVELVVVAAQSQAHERHTLRALRAGKHVLCEKPACRKVAALDRMIR
ncbi:MAG: Gfo/Idh/MocA family oxidoreductase, partial [Planctomycetota bacterium]